MLNPGCLSPNDWLYTWLSGSASQSVPHPGSRVWGCGLRSGAPVVSRHPCTATRMAMVVRCHEVRSWPNFVTCC
jgi:hypothetical protein